MAPVLISSLGGCRKASNLGNAASGAGKQDSGSFKVTIDGKPWVAIDSARSVSIMNGAINISGLSSDDQNIVLTLAGTTAGTYTLGPRSNSIAAWTDSFCYFQDWSTSEGNISQSGGQVVVSQITIPPISASVLFPRHNLAPEFIMYTRTAASCRSSSTI